ncbi:MAG: hypothetical protein ABJG88_09785 [Litorimonas sp.]
MKLHPYAVIIGLVIGVMVLFTLRHPLFALFAAVISVLGFDMAFKARVDSKKDK